MKQSCYNTHIVFYLAQTLAYKYVHKHINTLLFTQTHTSIHYCLTTHTHFPASYPTGLFCIRLLALVRKRKKEEEEKEVSQHTTQATSVLWNIVLFELF